MPRADHSRARFAAVSHDEILALARAFAPDATRAREFAPQGSVRTFRIDGVIVRVDEDPNGGALRAEEQALQSLASALTENIAPVPRDAGTALLGGALRRWLVYPFVDGTTLTASTVGEMAAQIGKLFARLHTAPVFDLRSRFPRMRPMTLLESFKQSSDELRQWMLAREADGLGQDLLTLTLSDLQRALRQYAMALDHHFLTPRRRVLCHGRPSLAQIVRQRDGQIVFVGLDSATLGDAAEDLALFAFSADLSPAAESTLLDAYLDGLVALGRPDPRFLTRYFARRTLTYFSEPMRRLDGLRKQKEGSVTVAGDPVVAIEEELRRCYADLVRGINGLRDLVGGIRPITRMEVEAMGRLVAYEEMLLSGRIFRVALTGLPYAGKTEVGAALARRLGHVYVHTTATGRALALLERRRHESGKSKLAPHALVKTLFTAGFEMQPIESPPYYAVHIGGEDVTAEIQEGKDRVRGATLLDEEIVQATLRDEFTRLYATQGIVVEGAYAHTLIPGRLQHFHLTCADEVRRARLMSHRPDVEGEVEAAALLRRLDEGLPRLPPDAVIIDLMSRPAAAATLEILWHLLPKNRRPYRALPDLSGRPPLFTT